MAENKETELIEILADIEHQRWADWHKHASKNWTEDNRARWDRQANTPYSELSEREKESDRKEVMRYWKYFLEAHAQGEKRGRRETFVKFENLTNYLEHERMCIRSFNEAGEPTPGGGYRQKFKGKWYQSKPVDETPKCDCGLDVDWEAFTKLKQETGD